MTKDNRMAQLEMQMRAARLDYDALLPQLRRAKALGYIDEERRIRQERERLDGLANEIADSIEALRKGVK